MRVFIAVLVLIFSLQTPSQADDIRDFQIEGMSVGDSLLDHFTEEEINKVDILTLLDISWQKNGLVKGDKIIATLTELVGDVAIENLPITFTAVASDIVNEKEVWLSSGSLFDAIRASISLPLFFHSPVPCLIFLRN